MQETGDTDLWDTIDGDVWKANSTPTPDADFVIGIALAEDGFQPLKGKHTDQYSMLPIKITVLNLSPDHRHRPETTWIACIAPGAAPVHMQ